MKIINAMFEGGPVASPPALVANTAVMNSLWVPVTVYLSGGTSVTSVQISNLAGGVSSVPLTTLVSQSSGPLPANTPIPLGPGQWIKVNTTGSLPTAVWVAH